MRWLFLLALLAGCAAQPMQPQSEQSSRAAIHTDLGAGYYGRGQYEIALQELNEAVRLDPDYADSYNIFGLVYMALRENGVAEQNFQHALRLSPKDSEINNNYGWFLCQTGRERESIARFLTALENPLYQTPEIANLNAGICSQKLKENAEAEKYYLKALGYKSQIPEALLGLAEMYFEEAKFGGAKNYLARFLQIAAPSAKSLYLGVRIERKLGERDAEAAYATQLQNRFPDSQEAQNILDGKRD